MKTGIEQLQHFSKHYSQEVLLTERYSPTALLSSFKGLINSAKDAVSEITNSFNQSQKAPAYTLGFDKTFLDHNQFRDVFLPLTDQVKVFAYTDYAALKKAKVPSGIELHYVETLAYLLDYTYKESLYQQLEEYKEMLSKFVSQDPTLMRSSINRYAEKMKKTIEPQQDILANLKKHIKNADKDFVKVSVVVANSAQWDKVYDQCFSLNRSLGTDKYDIDKINQELKIIGAMIDGIIDDLQSKKEIKGNAIILSELSEATLALATAVTLRADGITLSLETLGCIHETMSAIVQDQKKA